MKRAKVGQVYKMDYSAVKEFEMNGLKSEYDVVVVGVNEDKGTVMVRPIYFMGLPIERNISELRRFGGKKNGGKS